MEAIGGYFELELPRHKHFIHDDGVLLNSGRCALEFVLRSLGIVSRLWIPFFTCEVVLEPILKLGIPYSFYHINGNLEIKDNLSLEDNDYLLYTNYFGLKDSYVNNLANKYGKHLIIDNSQSWFSKPIVGSNTIYSPRKFVGVPDGGVAYFSSSVDVPISEQDYSCEKCSHLLIRIDKGPTEGYADFRINSEKIKGQNINLMSKLTIRVLSSIDFNIIKKKRWNNFEYLHGMLKASNQINTLCEKAWSCPMVYPYKTDDLTLRGKLIANKVYVATYWPNVIDWVGKDEIEYDLATTIIPLPIDQRYGIREMDRIVKIIKSNNSEY